MGMTLLYGEIHRWAGLPFIWGETDCLLCLADWIARVRGADPAAHLRGTYDSRGSCQRETGFFRDPVGVVESCLATIGGLPRTDIPEPGDIGLIVATEPDGRRSPCGAIWLGTCWGCKGQEGTTTVKPFLVQRLAAWSVGYAA